MRAGRAERGRMKVPSRKETQRKQRWKQRGEAIISQDWNAGPNLRPAEPELSAEKSWTEKTPDERNVTKLRVIFCPELEGKNCDSGRMEQHKAEIGCSYPPSTCLQI